ncbi:MAG: murein biosynthesis integral membrane protein MurJ [Gemmatimonadales bacterium]
MSRRGSFFVGAGILMSRMFGLVRQRVLVHYLGLQTEAADALAAAFRIPNFLQNLLGEGALSASFIPSYCRLLAKGDEREARRLAGALLAILVCTVTVIVLLGELATPWLMDVFISHDWTGSKRALTEQLVRVLFPGAGLLAISAWCLGVLNSHGRFLLSYASPVVWNLAIIVASIFIGRHQPPAQFAVTVAWGSVVGSLLQVVAQWPAVIAVGGAIRPVFWNNVQEIREVITAFVPNLISRGANQISAYIDLLIASAVPITGAVAAMVNAQVLYTLPVSLFGMAVSAAELPEMSREHGEPEAVARALRVRLADATERLAFYIVPSAVGFLALGGVVAGAIFQGGRFSSNDTSFVWIVLGGSSIGLLASTLGRLYASAFYALHDTRTPLQCGVVRVGLTAILGVTAALILPPALGVAPRWGVAGLTASAGLAGWVEFALLRRGIFRRVGRFTMPDHHLLKLWAAALVAAAVGTAARLGAAGMGPIPLALVVIPANAATYVALAYALRIPEARSLVAWVRGRSHRSPLAP